MAWPCDLNQRSAYERESPRGVTLSLRHAGAAEFRPPCTPPPPPPPGPSVLFRLVAGASRGLLDLPPSFSVQLASPIPTPPGWIPEAFLWLTQSFFLGTHWLRPLYPTPVSELLPGAGTLWKQM